MSTPPVHPLAALIPEMLPEEYADLRADIAANGLLDPVVMHDGQVLDGRHRLRACEETGIQLRVRQFTGDSPAQFVLSANVKRRHLSVSQRAALAVEFLPELEKEALARKVEGGRQAGRGRPRDRSGSLEPDLSPGPNRARREAGALVGVSSPSVGRAKRVKVEAPEVFEQVKAGVITVTGAERLVREQSQPQPESESESTPTPDVPLRGRQINLANQQQRRIEALVGQCTAFTSALPGLPVDFAVRANSPGDIAGWAEAIKEAERALAAFRRRLTTSAGGMTGA